MAPARAVPPSLTARVLHASLVTGVLFFLVIAWYIGRHSPVPAESLPTRRVLYIVLVLLSAASFGTAMALSARMLPRGQTSVDDRWRANLPRALAVWALIEAPALVGTALFLLTRDFRVLLATFIGLFLFLQYRPGRLVERV